MKKLLILLFLILISVNSYGEVELDFSSDTFCDQSPKVQVRNNLYYLPNTEKPYSGENLCVYLSNSQYYSQGKIKNGLRDGTWTYWNENGQTRSVATYKDNQIERQKNYQNGALINETQYRYYENGQISSERNEKDGKKDGKWTIWLENGQIKLEENYKDGVLDGKSTSWTENGQKQKDANYKDGNYDGNYTYWFADDWIVEKLYQDGECISGC